MMLELRVVLELLGGMLWFVMILSLLEFRLWMQMGKCSGLFSELEKGRCQERRSLDFR